MGIDVTKLKGYRADMTAEELVTLLEGANELAEKSVVDKLASENASYKKQLREYKSEEELAKTEKEAELKELKDSLEKANRELSVIRQKDQLMSNGYSSDLAQKSAEALIKGDMKSFLELQKQHLDETTKVLKEQILNETVLPDGGSEGKKELTKKDLDKMSIAELTKFAEDNPDQFNAIYDVK